MKKFYVYSVVAVFLPLFFLQVMAFAGSQGRFIDEHRQRLVVLNAQEETVFSCKFADGERFGIRFIHSVAKSPVIDWFVARNGILELESTVYQDFGAGLPHMPEAGQTMEQRDGFVIIRGYAMPLPRFDVRVGRIAEHTLLFPETWQEIALKSLAQEGAALTFSLQVHKK